MQIEPVRTEERGMTSHEKLNRTHVYGATDQTCEGQSYKRTGQGCLDRTHTNNDTDQRPDNYKSQGHPDHTRERDAVARCPTKKDKKKVCNLKTTALITCKEVEERNKKPETVYTREPFERIREIILVTFQTARPLPLEHNSPKEAIPSSKQ